jgi:casein kinase 1
MLAPVSTNTPGQSTPLSAAAQVNVPVAAMHRSGHNSSPQHPYAAGGFEYPRGEATEDTYNNQQPYGRAPPMMSAAAPPAVSQVRARAGDVGMSHDRNAEGGESPQEKGALWKLLTCNCG